jgi:hypothetical protein
VPLGFNPLCTRDPVEEVSATLSLLYSTRDKMLKLEAEGCAMVEAVRSMC